MGLKRRTKNFKKRYRRFEVLYFVLGGVFLLSAALEMLLFGEEGRVVLEKTEALPLFFRLFPLEGICYLASFLLGVTVYSVAFSFVGCVARGFFSGYVLSSLLHFSSASDVFLFLLSLTYLLISAWIFVSYASFAGSVSLRLFSDGLTGSALREEERMFGGTLFCSTLFQNRVNLRFLSSYVLIFFGFFAGSAAFTLLYAFLRSLFF